MNLLEHGAARVTTERDSTMYILFPPGDACCVSAPVFALYVLGCRVPVLLSGCVETRSGVSLGTHWPVVLYRSPWPSEE